MFPDSSVAKYFKCSRTKATAVLKVIAQNCWKTISAAVRGTKYFSLQTDETTDITINKQAAVMLRFFDNTQGQLRCVFFALERVERATAELLFNAIDKHFQESTTLLYDNLVGLAKLSKAILVIPHGNSDTEIQPYWSQQKDAQKRTRNFNIKFTLNSAIQCSSKML